METEYCNQQTLSYVCRHVSIGVNSVIFVRQSTPGISCNNMFKSV